MQDPGTERPFDLRRAGRVLRSRGWLLVVIPLLFAAAAYGLSAAQPSTYAASAQVVIRDQNARGVFDPDSGAYREPQRALQTEIQVILGESVRTAVEGSIEAAATISAQAVGLTDVVQITAESEDAELAAETANAYAQAYIAHSRARAQQTFLTAGEEIESTLTSLQEQIDELDRTINATPARPEALVERRNALIAQYSLFSQRLDQLQVDASLQESSVELVRSAEVPLDPVSPKPLRNAALGAVLGLLLAIALAFALDRLDDSITSRADVERVAPGLPILASIPSVASADESEPILVAGSDAVGQPAAEAYRTLRTAVQFLSIERPLTLIQVTSPLAAEGKSTTVANLALTLAENGHRVVVVCCDLRRPRIHEFFGLDNSVGFTSVLLSQVSLWDAVRFVPDNPNLAVLSAGPLPPNPSELLSTTAAAQALEGLREQADVVLVDSPPVLPVTDATVVARYVDGTILVASAGETSISHFAETVERLRSLSAPLIGMVLNRDTESPHASGRYGYGYVGEPRRSRRRRARSRTAKAS